MDIPIFFSEVDWRRAPQYTLPALQPGSKWVRQQGRTSCLAGACMRAAIALAPWMADIATTDATVFKAYLPVGGAYQASPANAEIITVPELLSNLMSPESNVNVYSFAIRCAMP